MAVTMRGCRAVGGRAWALARAGCLLMACLLTACLVAGCGLTERRAPAMPFVARHPGEAYPSIERPSLDGLAATLGALTDTSHARTKPINVLAVCAGGGNSAFNAGVLTGWSQAGARPTFDVVTGTSSGALIGVFAFLGPKYDAKLEKLFCGITTADLFEIRPVRCLIRDGAIASPRPLEQLLEAEINDAVLADLREAHAQGRRLFIGTTNFDTKRLVVWDLGAVASSGHPDASALVRRILLATCTWPGLLPPVEFLVPVDGAWRQEQHIDGGAAAQAFVRLGPTAGWPGPDESAPGWLAGSNLYVLAGGKLYDDRKPAPRSFFGRLFTGACCLIGSAARADICRLHVVCMSSGMRFHLLALPQDYVGVEQSIFRLNPEEMRRLYETGHRMALSGPAWRHVPPGGEPGEEETPHGAIADSPRR